MRLLTGTSGFAYKTWKGSFYPEDLPDAEMLAHYATKLATVEVNNTFYRMPKRSVLEGWRAKVPDDFVFVIKASQRITHKARLRDTAETVGYLWRGIQVLGPTMGPVLFQLPPYFRADVDALRAFLDELPGGLRAAFEFRHASWEADAVRDALRERGAALVVADTGDGPELPELPATADWGYVRLRREAYDDDQLAAWAKHLAARPWREAFVFLKHDEDDAASPASARRLAEVARTLGGR